MSSQYLSRNSISQVHCSKIKDEIEAKCKSKFSIQIQGYTQFVLGNKIKWIVNETIGSCTWDKLLVLSFLWNRVWGSTLKPKDVFLIFWSSNFIMAEKQMIHGSAWFVYCFSLPSWITISRICNLEIQKSSRSNLNNRNLFPYNHYLHYFSITTSIWIEVVSENQVWNWFDTNFNFNLYMTSL